MPNEFPRLLEEMKRKRDGLTQVIDILETHFSVPEPIDAAPAPRRGKPGPKPRRAVKRTEQGPRQRRTRSLPDEDLDAVIVQLRQHGAMGIGALETALKVSRYVLGKRLKALVAAKRVVITGNTGGRQVSLPSKHAAKEGP